MPPDPNGGPVPVPVPEDGLVDIDMTDIELFREDLTEPAQPDWDLGKGDQGDGIHYATNRLQRYKIKARYSYPYSELIFTVKHNP
jgi:hypothetical protein